MEIADRREGAPRDRTNKGNEMHYEQNTNWKTRPVRTGPKIVEAKNWFEGQRTNTNARRFAETTNSQESVHKHVS